MLSEYEGVKWRYNTPVFRYTNRMELQHFSYPVIALYLSDAL